MSRETKNHECFEEGFSCCCWEMEIRVNHFLAAGIIYDWPVLKIPSQSSLLFFRCPRTKGVKGFLSFSISFLKEASLLWLYFRRVASLYISNVSLSEKKLSPSPPSSPFYIFSHSPLDIFRSPSEKKVFQKARRGSPFSLNSMAIYLLRNGFQNRRRVFKSSSSSSYHREAVCA